MEYPAEPNLGINSQWHSVLPTASRFNGSLAEIDVYDGNSPGITQTLIIARDLETWVYVERINITDAVARLVRLQF